MARRRTSHKLLYRETNFMSLQERQSLNKIRSFSKIVENKCPDYLKNLLPEKIGAAWPTSRNAKMFLCLNAQLRHLITVLYHLQ